MAVAVHVRVGVGRRAPEEVERILPTEAEEDGVDDEDEFGVLQRPDPKRRSSTIEIIETNPTPTESPASAEPVLGTTEPVFKEEEGSPIYQSPLANANAPTAEIADSNGMGR